MSMMKIEKRICDICKKEMEHKEGSLLFNYKEWDCLGIECANGEIKFSDVCEECGEKIKKFITDMTDEKE